MQRASLIRSIAPLWEQKIATNFLTGFISHQFPTFPRYSGGRGGLVVRPRPRDRRAAGPKPDSTEDQRAWGPLHAKSYAVAKRPPVSVAWKLGEGVPAQVSSSSSDSGSKLLGPSLNSPRVASKLDVNLT
ncbi:hypothetical protein AVEN_55499-1 [Araneus ventricosus]|uniref:Uncharacterized protein n=1 Tax=Araneus ventricosus TaxID=182803 RepID=A0A4Y2C9E3_ARAVE|nr:hypothetical protein AVEN_55499-1 [Araneus ventricosus]